MWERAAGRAAPPAPAARGRGRGRAPSEPDVNTARFGPLNMLAMELQQSAAADGAAATRARQIACPPTVKARDATVRRVGQRNPSLQPRAARIARDKSPYLYATGRHLWLNLEIFKK